MSGSVQAACLTWLLCPYKAYPDDPKTRYVSIQDATLPDGTAWQEILVGGAGTLGLGQALVCVAGSHSDKSGIELAAQLTGCTVVVPGQVRSKLTAPQRPMWDSASGQIRLQDGQGGRPNRTNALRIPRGLDDPALQ